jgi:tetratricopeptide (TPR) repeat protein
MNSPWKSLGVVCALVIGMYAYTAPLGKLESLSSDPADTYYNLLVQGFRDGHLSLKKEAPTGFARLTDPYDPDANFPYRGTSYGITDLSYYKGRFYLYFGVTPALILFWPFAALTGHYLSNRLAVTIFCAVGVAVNLGLLRALWRRYFAGVKVGVVAACALAIGLATGVLILLPQSDVWQVPISCGYMLTMLSLGAVWCALHEPERRWKWLMAASVAYGLAVGARPSLLFGGLILLVPVVCAWQERRQIWAALLAAIIPITLIGFGLMLYNALRFDNPFEFGMRYQLNGYRQTTEQFFSPHFLWFNFLVNFLEPARWSTRFPFVHKAATPPLPSGYTEVQDAFGVLTNIPLAWLALAVPLAWRERPDQGRGALRWFVTAVCLLFGMCALTLGFFCTAAGRYQLEFLPALLLLAVIGILSLERALADWPFWRRLVRCGWGVLLGFSVAFTALVSVENYAYAGGSIGRILAAKGQVPEAIRVFENVVRIKPDYAEGHHDLGMALWQAERRQEAMQEYEYALRLKPDYAEAEDTLGTALVKTGRPEDAIPHYEEAIRIYSNLSSRAIKYGYVAAHVNLGNALLTQGKAQEASVHYEEALRLNPYDAEAHNNLGAALLKLGRPKDAIRHCEEALRINPDFAKAHNNLGCALEEVGRDQEAMEHWEKSLQLNPDDAEVHYNLGFTLEKVDRSTEAIEHYKQALAIRPDFTLARNALQQLGASQ